MDSPENSMNLPLISDFEVQFPMWITKAVGPETKGRQRSVY